MLDFMNTRMGGEFLTAIRSSARNAAKQLTRIADVLEAIAKTMDNNPAQSHCERCGGTPVCFNCGEDMSGCLHEKDCGHTDPHLNS